MHDLKRQQLPLAVRHAPPRTRAGCSPNPLGPLRSGFLPFATSQPDSLKIQFPTSKEMKDKQSSFPPALRPLAAGLAFLILFPFASAATLTHLRCEYRDNPLGLEVRQPRLSWEMQSQMRGDAQQVYQVRVASSVELLRRGQPDLWDSGEVRSEASLNVAYAGKPLVSGQRCFWQVRIHDAQGSVSAWSEPAWWTMGLLAESDWRGIWIGAEDGPAPLPVRRFLRNGDRKAAAAITLTEAPALLLRREAVIAQRPVRATAYVCGLGYFELCLNGRRGSFRGGVRELCLRRTRSAMTVAVPSMRPTCTAGSLA